MCAHQPCWGQSLWASGCRPAHTACWEVEGAQAALYLAGIYRTWEEDECTAEVRRKSYRALRSGELSGLLSWVGKKIGL